MNGYIALYNSKRIEVYANGSYEAQCKAAEILKVSNKNRHKISVMLAEKNEEQVTHMPLF